MFYVYFLLLKNGNVYKGFTSDLKRRYAEHVRGKVASTRHHRPVKLVAYEAYLLKSDAMRRERFLKTREGRRSYLMQYKDTLRKK